MKKNMFHEIEEDELLVLLCHVGNRPQESDVENLGNAASLPGRKGKGIVFGIVSDQRMAFTGYGIIVWQGNIHRGSPADKVSS